ncbi:MAG: DUF4129 domain-containing protein [Balneolaceae bacterium]
MSQKQWLLLVFVWMWAFPALAGNLSAQTIPADTTTVSVRELPDERIEAYQNRSEFDYSEEIRESDSLIMILLGELFRFIDRLLGTGPGTWVSRGIYIVLLLAAALLLLQQIFKGEVRTLFKGGTPNRSLQQMLEKEGIEQADLDTEISRALQEERYSDAIRFTYLKVLQSMNKAGVIQWAYSKTNYDYLREIGVHPVSNPFEKLTRLVVYTNYGNYTTDRRGVERARRFQKTIEDELGG